MNFKRIISIIICAFIFMSLTPVFAEETVELEFIDVTNDITLENPVLQGEAKLLLRVKGLNANATISQVAVRFFGNLKYKHIEYLQGTDVLPDGFRYIPDTTLTNINGEFLTSIITSPEKPVSLSAEGTDLFIITFEGAIGETATVSVNNEETYFVCEDEEYTPSSTESADITPSAEGNHTKNAVIELTMNKVTTFAPRKDSEYATSNVVVSITQPDGEYKINIELNNVLTTQGGHRDGTKTLPTFVVLVKLRETETYTVEVTGPGYIPYKAENVSFESTLKIDNSMFIPGDINGDRIVDEADIELLTAAIADPSLALDNPAAFDINRDTVINNSDLLVFENTKEEKKVPDKPAKPNVTATESSITANWSAPADGGSPITGYIIKYGTNSSEPENTLEVSSSTLNKVFTSLASGTVYCIKIAAKNEIGTGEFSDMATIQTLSSSGGGGGGVGGGGGGGGGGSSAPEKPEKPEGPDETKPAPSVRNFTDLSGYSWAETAIYTLKDKGIINGTSDTTYSPEKNIKRGDFMLIITKMLSITSEDGYESFNDVPKGSYYEKAIIAAKAAGIAKGSENGNFLPEAYISREDLITLVYRALLNAGYIEETSDFSSLDEFIDKDSVSGYSQAPMASMVKSGIIKGSNGKLNPKGFATRAEVAVMCERLIKITE